MACLHAWLHVSNAVSNMCMKGPAVAIAQQCLIAQQLQHLMPLFNSLLLSYATAGLSSKVQTRPLLLLKELITSARLVDVNQHSWILGLKAVAFQGAIGAVPNDATAYSHRDAIMIIQLMATWTNSSQQDSAQGWLNNLHTATLPYVAPDAAYLNYIDSDQADWARAYFGSNLPRLQQVKAQYDPENYWDKPQGIPASGQLTSAKVQPSSIRQG